MVVSGLSHVFVRHGSHLFRPVTSEKDTCFAEFKTIALQRRTKGEPPDRVKSQGRQAPNSVYHGCQAVASLQQALHAFAYYKQAVSPAIDDKSKASVLNEAFSLEVVTLDARVPPFFIDY